MAANKEIFREANILIDDNILEYNNLIVQLSNISQVEVAPIPKEKYPPLAIAGILAGLYLLIVNVALGLVFIGACAFWLYKIYEKNESLGKYLILELNSGRLLLFSCNDVYFLNEVVELMKGCFRGNNGKWFVNFGNCQIGDHNKIKDKK